MASLKPLQIGFLKKRQSQNVVLLASTALFFLSLMGLGTTALHIRANAEAPPEANPPVSVTVRLADFSEGYSIAERSRLQAQRGELDARLELAKATLGRQQALATKGWQSEQRHDEARFNVIELRSDIQRVDASINAIDIDLQKSELRAPYSGTVAARRLDEGAVVNAGAPVIEPLESGAAHVRVGVSVEAAEALEKAKT